MDGTSADRARRVALGCFLLGAIVLGIGYVAYAPLVSWLPVNAFSAVFVWLPAGLWLITIAIAAIDLHDRGSRSGPFGLGLIVIGAATLISWLTLPRIEWALAEWLLSGAGLVLWCVALMSGIAAVARRLFVRRSAE